MHRVTPHILALWLAVLLTSISSAQTPQKIVDAYVRARGGAARISQIRATNIAGSLREESTGQTGSFALIAKAPNHFYTEIIAGPDRVAEAYNGMSGWSQDPAGGARTLTGGAARQSEASGRYWNGLLAGVKKSKAALELIGTEKVRGRDAYHVRVILGPGLARDVFFDAATHLIVREIVPSLTSSGSQQFDYDDFRPVNGIPSPFAIELRRDGRVFTISVTRAEFNGSIEDTVFDFPRTQSAPVPEIKALILEVTRNQRAIEELQKEYTCHLTAEQEKLDSKGRTASKTIKEYEVFYVDGEEVRHLIAKDGKPLSGGEKQKEDERFKQEFAKLQKRADERAADPKKQRKQAEKEEAQISDFLRALRFTNARRERFRGQEVLAVDFGPNPDYKPKKSIEHIIQKLAGVVWIDEHARDVARLEAHFSDSVRIGAGIVASLDKGSNFVFEQAKINDEVWLPSYAEVHAAGRLLVVRLKQNQIDRYTDYKRFRAESKIVGVE